MGEIAIFYGSRCQIADKKFELSTKMATFSLINTELSDLLFILPLNVSPLFVHS
jgi:hypothetical protein